MTVHRWVAILLLGCNDAPLDEVSIVGGTTAQRAEAEEILARFDADTGGAVRLRAVRFERDAGALESAELAGSYRNNVVRIDTSVHGDELVRVLGHELCHALDDDLGLSASHPAALDALRPLILDGIQADRSAKHARREALARLCDAGGEAASMLALACDDLPLPAESMFGVLADAFPGVALRPARAPLSPAVVTAQASHPADRFSAALRTDGLLKLTWSVGDGHDIEEAAELETGVFSETEPATLVERADADGFPALRTGYLSVVGGEPASAQAAVPVLPFGTSYVLRTLVLDDIGEWRVAVDRCDQLGHASLFTARGQLWLATHDERTTWTTLIPSW